MILNLPGSVNWDVDKSKADKLIKTKTPFLININNVRFQPSIFKANLGGLFRGSF